MKLSFAAALALSSAFAKVNPDAFKSFEDIASENGFDSEMTTLTTSDGYNLSLYRIPRATGEPETSKPPVLIIHAQDCDMMEWLWNDADKANALLLARAGYDVWLGNNRGNKYSNTHTSLTTKDAAYWDYYQQDMAEKDLPTFIDHILEVTGQDQLSYIGHSEGTTQMFLGASLNPEYFKQKVKVFAALAPVASTSHISSPIAKALSPHISLLKIALADVLGYRNWFAPMPKAVHLVDAICGGLFSFACKDFFKLLHHDGVDNFERFTVFMSNEPSGQSYRTFVYYAQMINDGRYSLYDYGKRKNKEIYGTEEAPLVPIEDLDIPVGLFSGDLDRLADPEDVAFISEKLGDKVVFQKQYHLDHFSFALAEDMSYFQDVISLLDRYNKPSLDIATN